MKGMKRKRKTIMLLPFIGPALLLNIAIVLVPSVATVVLAFFEWSGLDVPRFVGIKNFVTVLTESLFLRAVAHNIVWTAIFLTVPIAMGLLGAELLRRTKRELFQPIYFFPVILPVVVIGLIWRYIYHPTRGLGKILGVSLLGQPSTALFAIAFANIWAWWGFLCAVFYSATQGIPHDLYEAATLDGATGWQEFRYITLPQILPTLTFMEVMTIIWSFQVFDWIWVTTQGGPAGATELLATLLYKRAFYAYKMGEASAIGVCISLFGLAGVGLYYYLARRGAEI
jgi:raffinose/stachyose/melibiose transport system permease protein